MKPPICEICNKDFDPQKEGGLLYFKQTKEDKRFEKRMRKKGFDGHPTWATWFCGKHYRDAKELIYLPLSDALKKLR